MWHYRVMKFSLTNRLYSGFSAAVLLVLLLGILSYHTFQRQTEAGDWVKHTYQVLNKAATIDKLLVDMEAGNISYRSTNVREFLKPYNEAILNIKPAINDLKALVVDNLAQSERVSRITANVETLLIFWQKQDDRKLSVYNQADFVDLLTREKAFINRIRDELDQLIRTENTLLTQRENENKRSSKQAMYELIFGTFLTLLIVLTLIYFTIKEFNNYRQTEATLQENYKELELLNQVSIEKNWLLTGISAINDNLQAIDDVTSLRQSILKTITTYLNLPASAFYLYDQEKEELQLNASVALPKQMQISYKLGEGLVGQAATERSLILTSDIPNDFWMIQAGTGQSRPGQVVCLPLWYNKELKGVVELASFQPLPEQGLLLLKSVANNIAIAINAADYYEKAMSLLQQVQEQKEALENQQEELQQSNSELIRQAEVLQTSEQELKVQEEELRQINTELLERNNAVETAREELAIQAKELEINSKYKSEFLANMSHELRTPLNSVLILARLLVENKQQNLTEKQVEYASIIHKSGSDLLELINDILDLSKIEAGKIAFLFEQASVASISNNMDQLFRVVADQKGVRLSVQIGDEVPASILTDKQRLEQIIKNLLSNALKFTPKGGTVVLSLNLVNQRNKSLGLTPSVTQDVLAIAVKDTGIGIPPEKQQLIFEAFQQGDGSISRKFGGTGLGLSISKELIRRLGGELSLQSEVGSGSTFTLYLPLKAAPNADQLSQVELPQISASTASAKPIWPQGPSDDRHNLAAGDRVILIIEDDPAFAGIIQDFARNKRFKTIIALRGDEGLQYARQYVPSAIILDIGLPVLNGWDLLELLKNDEALQHIPVHVISAFDEPSTLHDHILTYTTKPVGKKDLENVLNAIDNQLKGRSPKVLVLRGNGLNESTLKLITGEAHMSMECDYITTWEEARQRISGEAYNCFIADIGQSGAQGVLELQELRKTVPRHQLPFIVLVDKDSLVQAEQPLEEIPGLLIRNSPQSKNRLTEELELFFHEVNQTNTPVGSTVNAVLPSRTVTTAFVETLRGKKVLLVDDDMRNVFALSALLEENQMTVITAGNGLEALDQLNQHTNIALVLMDIMMPEMDGYEATQRIRADERFAYLPVIALTAKAMTIDREKCLEAGASDYITKPVDSTQLLSLMQVWLS